LARRLTKDQPIREPALSRVAMAPPGPGFAHFRANERDRRSPLAVLFATKVASDKSNNSILVVAASFIRVALLLSEATICAPRTSRRSTIKRARFRDVFLHHGSNLWWSFGIAQNAIDRLDGEATKLVFVVHNRPGS